jgi:hypothetical protein
MEPPFGPIIYYKEVNVIGTAGPRRRVKLLAKGPGFIRYISPIIPEIGEPPSPPRTITMVAYN